MFKTLIIVALVLLNASLIKSDSISIAIDAGSSGTRLIVIQHVGDVYTEH